MQSTDRTTSSTVTPLALAGRKPPRPRTLSAEAQAQVDAWYAMTPTARVFATEQRDWQIRRLRRAALDAHVALDLAEYAEVA